MSIEPLASIVIPVKNPEPWFHKVLDAILSQNITGSIEVILIDSGGSTEVKRLASERSFQYVEIPPEEFSHGGTRNYGSTLSKGEYVIFLSQDALPSHSEWLKHLIEPMTSDSKIAGVFSRQIYRPDTHPMEKYFLSEIYKPEKKVNSGEGKEVPGFNDVFFSNVSSAIRRDIALSFPFDTTLVMSEDQRWSKDVIIAGYKTVYEPQSVVVHSHIPSLATIFQRNFDSGASLRNIFDHLPGGLKKNIASVLGLLKCLYDEKKIQIIPFAILYEVIKTLGFLAGWNEKNIPDNWKVSLGQNKVFWKKNKNSSF